MLALLLTLIMLTIPTISQVPNALAAEKKETVLSTSQMDVQIDKAFPQVIQYKMKKGADKGKVFYGQPKKLNTILINGVSVKPTVKTTVSKTSATYVMTCKDTKNEIDAVLTAKLSVKNKKIVKTVEIPNHNLISARSTQKNAVLDAANMSLNTHINGDRKVKITKSLATKEEAKKGYMYAFLSTNQLSAGIFTNAESNLADQEDYKVLLLKQMHSVLLLLQMKNQLIKRLV